MLKHTVLALSCIALLMSSISQANGLPDFTKIAENQSKAVVKITTVTQSKTTARRGNNGQYNVPPEQLPELFRHFFQDPRGLKPQQRESRAMGSGFIISDDGYLITNNHVIENADDINVILSDRREFKAQLVGTDERSDLALLKIDGDDLPVLTFADPSQLKVGEWVLAIGSPFGLDYSVSAGIVSAMGRSIPNGSKGNYVPCIQTDVAINPGNSGGPLFNLNGEVVGVNSQIYTTNGGSVGLSFAIPTGLVLDVVEQLKDSGEVKRGWLGVGIQDVNGELAESFDLERPVGALISFVEKLGPAAKGGIKVGDVITHFNGEEIISSADLPHVVGLAKPGSSSKVTVIRDGKKRTLKVKVGTLDSKGAVASGGQGREQQSNRLGMSIQDIDSSAVRDGQIGVVVNKVEPDSVAAYARIKAGDVITHIGRREVQNTDEFNRVVAKLPAERPVSVRIVRSGRPGFVTIRIPAK